MVKVFSNKGKLDITIAVKQLYSCSGMAKWSVVIREEPDNNGPRTSPNKVNISGLFVSLCRENAEIPNQLHIKHWKRDSQIWRQWRLKCTSTNVLHRTCKYYCSTCSSVFVNDIHSFPRLSWWAMSKGNPYDGNGWDCVTESQVSKWSKTNQQPSSALFPTVVPFFRFGMLLDLAEDEKGRKTFPVKYFRFTAWKLLTCAQEASQMKCSEI